MNRVIKVLLFSVISFTFSCIGADPCDVKCDNCSSPESCIECYDQCYESR